MSEIIERDGTTGRFLAGGKGGPGRKPGSRNRLSTDLLTAFADDFEKNGAAVIEQVRRERPEIYLKLAVDMLPKDFHVTTEHHYSVAPEAFAARFRYALELLGNDAPGCIPKVIDGRRRDT